ncbi:MAG: transcription termination/antitermination factor NusG [Oscillospiraceae bacterium]|nr:transcription termination/antitermination factor NusG [Oscillospiraceae bacterium]
MSQAAKWYVIHTYSGYENKVVQNIEKVVENRKLHDLIQEVFIPTEHVTEIVDGKTKEVERKTFPGYVLVKMVYTDDSWAVVRSTRGVTGFVGPGSVPTPLSEREVAAMGVESKESVVEVDYSVGDRIRVTGTNLDGFTGIVRSIDLEAGQVEVLVNMFGRDTPTTIALHQAVKLDD